MYIGEQTRHHRCFLQRRPWSLSTNHPVALAGIQDFFVLLQTYRNLLFVPSQLSERELSSAKTVTMDSSYISPLNLNHSSPRPLPPIPSTSLPLRIAPRFQSNRWAYHPDAICVVVLDVNELLRPSTPVSPGTSSPSSPSSPLRWGSTSPTWSYASSTRSKSPSSAWGSVPRSPTHFLRRKPSPKRESLRALRAKDSDACLQRIYEQQTLAYLEGTMFLPTTPKSKLRMEELPE